MLSCTKTKRSPGRSGLSHESRQQGHNIAKQSNAMAWQQTAGATAADSCLIQCKTHHTTTEHTTAHHSMLLHCLAHSQTPDMLVEAIVARNGYKSPDAPPNLPPVTSSKCQAPVVWCGRYAVPKITCNAQHSIAHTASRKQRMSNSQPHPHPTSPNDSQHRCTQ